MLAKVIGRDGQELSATGTGLRNLANTDHLAILHAIWQGAVAHPAHHRTRRPTPGRMDGSDRPV